MRPGARLHRDSSQRRARAAPSALCAFTALVAATIALGACGTSVQQHQVRYASALRAIDASFRGSVHRLLTSVTPTAARSQTARAVGRFELELATVETRLRALRAPAHVARRHRHLVRAIDRYATGLRLEVEALRSGSTGTLARTGRRMLAATQLLSTDVSGTVASIQRILGVSAASSA